jgi:hypothetical protein
MMLPSPVWSIPMITDPYHQLKTDLYTTVPDLLICEAANASLPYRLILWGGAISRDEATRRIGDHGTPGMLYLPQNNPSIGGIETVSVIETDDKHAERTIAHDLFSTCYRVVTPTRAKAEEAKVRSLFPWRLMCRTRPPVLAEFDHIVDRDERMIAYHTGYRPDAPRWAPDIGWLGTIYAIHVRDYDTAILLKTAIGDCDLE